ncbi:DegT/DnrJ/EryC1/StrS family aminotransferase [uncultured Methanolobus sp.]|uniref:DegT/DnrJ/EryC1/StrS family aminotransferase n=1 Tax=uncultured Methanolobus sp. TaxID=218300 RepID=UPI0029C867A8|nr:DegT/DnrJ/EryC1/StrS family aminotransferase [uncultured Methanolobus sp.]
MQKRHIRLSKSVIGEDEKKAVSSVLDREYLGMGQDVQLFEKNLSSFFERDAVCVNTGTAALHLALQALGVGPGDEVLVQSLTYVASFQAISATGARPIPCEVDPATITLDVDDAKSRLTGHTRVVMPVHYASGMGDLDGLYEFAEENDLRVVEDAAHAFGCHYNGRKVGSFGDIACFSFDGIKNITSGEGGAIVTNDAEVLRRVRDARLLGVEKDTDKRYSGERSWDFDVSYQGWRYHMSNVMAAIGNEQLKKFSDFAEKRQSLLKRYQDCLVNMDSIKLLDYGQASIVPHIFVIKLCGSYRSELMEMLGEVGIQTGVHYKPNHHLSFYSGASLPVTDEIAPKLLTLPLHPDLTLSDVDYICDHLKHCLVHLEKN